MRIIVTLTLATAFFTAARVHASYCIYAGKNLTADGSVFLAGYGDEPSSHWLDIVPRRQHPAGAMITVGATGTLNPTAQVPAVSPCSNQSGSR